MSSKESQQTVLGPDCKIKGEMQLDGDGVIMGQFHGTLRVNGMLELTDSSQVNGTIIAGALRLGGHAEGNVIAEHGVELLAGTELSGRLFTNRLSIVDGASFAGEVVVGPRAMEAANEVIREVDGTQADRPRTAAPRSFSEPSVETVSTSLDKILKQHRARTKTAETAPSNGS